MRGKKSTFSKKDREKVHFGRKSTPSNPDLATGLYVVAKMDRVEAKGKITVDTNFRARKKII